MLYLLSPAKSLDYEIPTPKAVAPLATDPLFIDRSAELMGLARSARQTERVVRERQPSVFSSSQLLKHLVQKSSGRAETAG